MQWIIFALIVIGVAAVAAFYGFRIWRRRRTMKNMRVHQPGHRPGR